MYLEISTTHRPATDLGFLLHKNPNRLHQLDLAFGKAWLCFPEATEGRCTAALILDVDTVGLVRGKSGGDGLMQQYVNDRPYAASSFLSVAMGRMIREAISGRSKERQELAETALPLTIRVAPLPARGGPDLLHRLFEPLGHSITCEPIPMDAVRRDWGASPYVTLMISGTIRLSDLLSHLYVLIPVLDARKHYYVGDDELEKLLARGEGWLKSHPERELIVSRYLKGRSTLVREALARLTEGEDAEPETALDNAKKDIAEEAIEKPLRLHDHRLDAVADALKRLGAARVLDLGCGEGKLIGRLIKEKQFAEIVGVEVSSIALARAADRLERLPDRVRARVKFLQGALIYRDARLRGYDAAALVEVIEHIEPERLIHMERAVFGDAAPRAVIVTTPNADYNVLFEKLSAGQFRHADHRFEWTRAEFSDWCARIAKTYGYEVSLEPLGDIHESHGAPSQMGIFCK
ncbi:MAG: 3' terminal RNA ribose 2'-O-methyltransferase Hen1 [Hyphomicrobium sp.]|nr:3' terminal RNA ribose 2'-O-methyltransferase Hen1 [Hyphomicrobium sp.]